MKVLQVGKYYYPERGGIESVVKELSEGLVETGCKVTVLCANTKNISEDGYHNGVFIKRLSRWGVISSQPIIPGLFLYFLLNRKDFDVFHLHSPNPLVELASFLLPKRKVIVTYHCDVKREKGVLSFYKKLLQSALRRARVAVASSPQMLNFSKLLGTVRMGMKVIPFGIKPLPQISEKIKTNLYILFVGRLVPYKGVKYLIEAMKEVRCELRIVGTGPEEPYLRAYVKQEKLEDRVKFMGALGDIALHSSIINCGLLVLPSVDESEAFGIVLLEAMSCGKPLVTTQIQSGVNFVNINNVTGLSVRQKNPQALADAINKILSDKDLYERYSAAARKRFENEFNLEKMIQGYLSEYRNIVK